MTTKTAQFTPGPWHVSECASQTTKAGICSANGLHITDINGYGMTDAQNQANAALIAAAPAMYEALQVAQRYLEQCQGHDEEWQIVTNALAQAEGR